MLGIGFREWVPIRNIIGGAAGAHIPMTFGLPLSASLNVNTHKFCFELQWQLMSSESTDISRKYTQSMTSFCAVP